MFVHIRVVSKKKMDDLNMLRYKLFISPGKEKLLPPIMMLFTTTY